MIRLLTLASIWILLCLVDVFLYVHVSLRHGPQGKFWPMSGIYLWWKNR